MKADPSLPKHDTASQVESKGSRSRRKESRTPGEPKESAARKGPDICTSPLSPRKLLKPYQLAWVDDTSRFKYGLWSRQTGKDFSSGEEGIRDCFEHDLRGEKTTWLIGAAGERQALESLEKWKEWAEAYRLAVDDAFEEREGGSESLLKASTIVFPHGSRVIAVPANPNTVRGYSANVLLTEFAFIEDPDATWRAILPSITNPLRGGEKKIRIITTPNGQGNKAHELWQKNYGVQGAKWSCHKVTIEDAVRMGLPIDIDELREALADPEGWAQEFLCEFLDTAAVLLPYEVIAPCENPLATEIADPAFWLSSGAGQAPLVMGVDFGRKKDLTVAWTLEELGGAYLMTKEVFCMQGVSTDKQLEALRPRIQRARRVCFDYTGPGVGLGDFLVKEFGEYAPESHLFGKIELCTFTQTIKQDIFPKLRMRFDAKTIGVPVSREVREDLHSVHRVSLAGGGITYRAPHTPSGHADRCTALALANRAAATDGNAIFLPRPGNRTGQRMKAKRSREVSI